MEKEKRKFDGMREGVTIIVTAIMLFFGILFWSDIKGMFSGGKKENSKEKIKKEKKDKNDSKSDASSDGTETNLSMAEIKILERWDLPKELTEISGIAYLGNGKFACVQDEKGVIFIYDISSEKIDKQIAFSGAGDFEGITQVGQSLYVIRADGKLFKIENMNATKPAIIEYETGLTIKNNIESLCYDKASDRLLLTGKDEDPDGPGQKRIYSYNLKTNKLNSSPAFTIDLNNELLSGGKKGLQPSAIGVNPVTSEIYIVDGPAARLIVLDEKGTVINSYSLDSEQLPQAEGISFEENGNIYISTEGDKGLGAIVKVSLPGSK